MAIKDYLNFNIFSKNNTNNVNNYKYEIFDTLSNEKDIKKLSVIDNFFKSKRYQEQYGGALGYSNSTFGSQFETISTNKIQRLLDYHKMSNFPEVGDAIDEICDESITKDENGKTINIRINKSNLSDRNKNEIELEFNRFISLFDFESNMFNYMRTFVIEGQLAWENLININNTDAGIIGINILPNDTYEFGVNTISKDIEGLVVFSDISTNELNNQYLKNDNKANVAKLDHYSEIKTGKAIFLPWEQLTYIDTGIYDVSKKIVYPVLEKARKPYNQLSLIEDSIIIYRLVRAPERFVFNVDTGGLSRHRAEQEVMKMMMKYNTKKTYDPNSGAISNSYDPYSMMESYWFVKSANGGGTDVSTIGGGGNLGELEDLEYFHKKLYLSLKIPFSRITDPSNMVEKDESISYEDYKFSKFILRLFNNFEKGLKNSFLSHLKLKGIYNRLNLSKRDIQIKFTPPSNFDLYQSQKLFTLKIDNYQNLQGAFSELNTFALRRCGYTNDEIDEIWSARENDALRMAQIEKKVEKIQMDEEE